MNDSTALEYEQRRQRAGFAYALAAYGFWGVVPVYFVWVSFAQPLEVLAHRVVWSVPLLAILITLARQWPAVRAIRWQQMRVLWLCSLLLSCNWLIFIFAIQAGRISETSLGYFINPLVSIVLGWLFLKETMRPVQWAAAALAAVGVASEVVAQGALPWLGLSLAFSFGLYGLLRKQLAVPSSVGLGIETLFVAPLGVAYLLWLTLGGASVDREWVQVGMLGLGGLVTVLPLIWFASAAVRIPLTMLGFCQYIAPSLSLLIAVFVFEEQVPAGRWLSFALIWLGLLLFSIEALHHYRRQQRLCC
ncbi:MAG: EamA family transporter RarD [bacterium]